MRTLVSAAGSTLAGVLLSLCVGAVWAVVTLFTRDQAPWMVLPAALVAVAGSAFVPPRRPWLRAIVAAILTGVSVAYAFALVAASIVAGSLDVPLLVTLGRIGPEMAFAIASARTGPVAIAMLAAGALLAATLAFRRASRAAQAT